MYRRERCDGYYRWFRWEARLLALCLLVTAVVLAVTVPTVSTGTCFLSPWGYWQSSHRFGSVVGSSPPPSVIPHLVACSAVIENRWHVAWGLGLGALVLVAGSFVPSRRFARSRRRIHRVHPA